MRKPLSFKKKILLWVAGFISAIVLTIVIIVVFFLDGILNKTVRPELAEWVRRATHYQYELILGKIDHSFTSLSCRHVVLIRVRYDSLTPGFYIKKCFLDTISISGISWWDILWKNGLKLDRLEIHHPSLHISTYSNPDHYSDKFDTAQFLPTIKNIFPSIAIDSILLSNIAIVMESDTSHQRTVLKGTSLTIGSFGLDTMTMKTNKYLLFSKSIHINARQAIYTFDDSIYSLEIKGLNGVFEDSSLSVDTLRLRPNYSEQAFANKNKYNRGRLFLECIGLKAEQIYLTKLLRLNSIRFRSASVKSWKFDYYSDKRKPSDPNPPPAPMPNELLRKIGFPIHADSLRLPNGFIHIREQSNVSPHLSELTFEKTKLTISPLLIDSSVSMDSDAVHFSLQTLFQGQGALKAEVEYPLSKPSFDMDIAAHIGGFDGKTINSYLVNTDRTQVASGKVISGDIIMHVRNGTATTAVTPRFEDLSITFLSKKSSENRTIWDRLKTTWANIFVIRSNNIDKEGKPAKTAITTRKRLPPEEFFQFLWFSLRKSLGQIVGGFE